MGNRRRRRAVPRHLDFTAKGWAVNEIPPAIPASRPLVTRCRTGAYAGQLTLRASVPLQPEQTPAVERGSHRNRLPCSRATTGRLDRSPRFCPAQPTTIDRLCTAASCQLNAPLPERARPRNVADDRQTGSKSTAANTTSRAIGVRIHLIVRHASRIVAEYHAARSQATSSARFPSLRRATGDAHSHASIIESSFTSFAAESVRRPLARRDLQCPCLWSCRGSSSARSTISK